MGECSGVHATVDAAGVEVAAGTGVAAGAAATAAFAAGAPPPSVYVLNAPTSALLLTMIASSLPTGTSFVPAGTTIFASTPSSCASNASVALSVSISHSTSPGPISSPCSRHTNPIAGNVPSRACPEQAQQHAPPPNPDAAAIARRTSFATHRAMLPCVMVGESAGIATGWCGGSDQIRSKVMGHPS